MNQTRRRYLLALAGAGVAGVAGCSGGGDDTPTGAGTPTGTPTEDGSSATQQSTTVPSWASWVPAELVVSGGYGTVAGDVQRIRTEFPSDSQWNGTVQAIADGFGVDPASMTEMLTIEGDSDSLTVVTGTFDPEAVRSQLGVSESETDSYREFTVFGDSTAVGESAIIQGQYQPVLDTRFGSQPALGTTDDDWVPLLSTLTDGTLVTAEPGYDGDASFSAEPLRHGYVINAASDGGSVLTAQFLFASESQATTVYDNDQALLSAQFDTETRTVRRLDQRGRRVVIVTEQDSFDI